MNKNKRILLYIIVLLSPFLGIVLSHIIDRIFIPPLEKLVGTRYFEEPLIAVFSIISIYICVLLASFSKDRK